MFNFCPHTLFRPHLLVFSAVGLSRLMISMKQQHTILFHASITFAHDVLSRTCFISTFKISSYCHLLQEASLIVNSLTRKRRSQPLSSLCYLSPFTPFTGAPKILYCNCLCRISPLGLWHQKVFYSLLRWTNAKHIKTHKKCILNSFFWSLNQVFLGCAQISVSKFSIWPLMLTC